VALWPSCLISNMLSPRPSASASYPTPPLPSSTSMSSVSIVSTSFLAGSRAWCGRWHPSLPRLDLKVYQCRFAVIFLYKKVELKILYMTVVRYEKKNDRHIRLTVRLSILAVIQYVPLLSQCPCRWQSRCPHRLLQ
jgi:hypothetical protein